MTFFCYIYFNKPEAFMKSFLTLLTILITTVSVFASTPACLGEAQIIAKVSSIADKDSYDCVVHIDAASIVQYNINQICPLDLGEVLAQGVSVGLANGHDCSYSAGDDISGVIVKKEWGTLVLE